MQEKNITDHRPLFQRANLCHFFLVPARKVGNNQSLCYCGNIKSEEIKNAPFLGTHDEFSRQ